MMTSRVDRYFLIVAVLFALAGMIFGIHMGITQDFTLHSMHAHINLLGWVTLSLFGISYRVGFADKDKLAVIHFFVATVGAVVAAVGIYFAEMKGQESIVITGSLLTLLSMVLFLVNVLRQRA